MRLRSTLAGLMGRPDPFRTEPAMEVIYRDLMRRELAKLGEEDDFFPVGGAANYSLLYLILRVATEFRPRSVLDIGAGQSSLLWSRLSRHGLVADVLTLENDEDWGRRIGAQVEHPVMVTPLARMQVAGRVMDSYDWTRVLAARDFEVMVCDGPRGTARHSRWGVLRWIDEQMPTDFLLILDDAERVGEQDTIGAIHHRLRRLGIDYAAGVTNAAKCQMMFAGGRYRPAIFL